jgi:hypothetical protein
MTPFDGSYSVIPVAFTIAQSSYPEISTLYSSLSAHVTNSRSFTGTV